MRAWEWWWVQNQIPGQVRDRVHPAAASGAVTIRSMVALVLSFGCAAAFAYGFCTTLAATGTLGLAIDDAWARAWLEAAVTTGAASIGLSALTVTMGFLGGFRGWMTG